MYELERHNLIIEILKKNKSISVTKLAELLYVSLPTVRRDLSILEEQGSVVRTHGGAVLRDTGNREIPLMWRESQNNSSKKIIAERASALIGNGNVIFMDASSTVSYLVPHLERFKDIIVITNSPKTSMKLGEAGIKNYCTGGLMLMHSVAYVGNEAESFVSNINADILFFSSRGYTDEVITDSSVEEALVRQAMLKNAEKAYYLADSSKKGKKYMYNICYTDTVDGIITDE